MSICHWSAWLSVIPCSMDLLSLQPKEATPLKRHKKKKKSYILSSKTITHAITAKGNANFCNYHVVPNTRYGLCCHLKAQLPAVVLSAAWTWLAVSGLSQHCALHMKQDMGLNPLGEFTSSEPSNPTSLPKQATPSAGGQISWALARVGVEGCGSKRQTSAPAVQRTAVLQIQILKSNQLRKTLVPAFRFEAVMVLRCNTQSALCYSKPQDEAGTRPAGMCWVSAQ